MKKSVIIFFLLLCLINLTACSGKKSFNPIDSTDVNYKDADSLGYIDDNSVIEKDTWGIAGQNDVSYNERKMITTVDMSVETKEFDSFIQKLNDCITECGAYSEKFNLSQSNYKSSRYATYVIRIPSENLFSFLDETKQMVNVLNYSEKTDDVSLQYADIEGRLSSLKAEQSALNKMLENAVNVSESIEIQKRLSVVRGDIESYESQLRILSSKITYSTLNLSVDEVIELTVDNQEISVWKELADKFKSSFDDTISYLRNMFVEIFGGIPYILAILATLIVILFIPFIIVLIIILCIKKNKKKKKSKQIPINTVSNLNQNINK